MSRRRLTITVDGNLVVVRGWKASGTLRCAGLRATFSGSAGGWMVDVARLPELLAWLDDRRLTYALEGDRPAAVRDLTPEPAAEAEPAEDWRLW